MLRVLTLATLFPNAARPTLGVFVERQTLGLAALDDVEVRVVAPVGLPAWPLSLHRHYAPLRRLPEREQWKGLSVHRPRYRVWPAVGARRTAAAMADALLPYLRELRRRFPFDVLDAEFFWPDGPAALRLAEALGVPYSIKARGADIHYWAKRPGIAEQIVEAGRRADGLLAVGAELKADMIALGVPYSIKARGADIHYWAKRPGIAEQIVEAGRRADGLLAVGAALKADMVALGLPGENIRVHHTGVDLDRFRPLDRDSAKRALGVEGPLLVCAGALIPRKGQSVAIEALALVPGATLALVGDGPDRAALERLARRHGVAGRVRFVGARPHDELPAWLAAADVAVQPSASEGLANVWVEALACGTPVVTGDVGGAREAIDRPAAGRLVARDPEAIAAAVRELLAEPPAPGEVRRSAERFSWDRNAAELAEHLSALAGK